MCKMNTNKLVMPVVKWVGGKRQLIEELAPLMPPQTFSTYCEPFIGGGALLLRKYLENSEKTGKCVFIEDICANAKGYELLYQVQKKGR